MPANKSRKLPALDNSPTIQRVISALGRRAPLSAAELARDASVSLSTLVNGGYLKRLKDAGSVFIAGWGKNPNGFTIALYSLGNSPDCPRPKFQDTDRDSQGLVRIVAALKQKSGLATPQLAKAAGLSINTIRGRGYMALLLKQQRAHICDWRRSRSGAPSPLYAVGPGKNAPKPAPLTKTEIRQRHRLRVAITQGQLPTLGQQLIRAARITAQDSRAGQEEICQTPPS